jgi:hypothetical protein
MDSTERHRFGTPVALTGAVYTPYVKSYHETENNMISIYGGLPRHPGRTVVKIRGDRLD